MKRFNFYMMLYVLLVIITGCAATQMPEGRGVICDNCKGVGEKFVCGTCLGSGNVKIEDGQEWVKCPKCSGDGIIEGYWRRKYLIAGPKEEYVEPCQCDDCKGKGWVYETKFIEIFCTTCLGTGQGKTHLICNRCKGTGRVANNSIWMVGGWSEAK